jgi:hypothetical protein
MPDTLTVTEASFAGTLPAIQRTQDHRYIYQGVTYPGVTSVLGVIDKSGALMTWAARQTAEALLAIHEGATFEASQALVGDAVYNPNVHVSGLDTLMAAVGRDGVIKAATSRANWQRDEAAQLGTRVHALADQYAVTGMFTKADGLSDATYAYVENYAEWWDASGWKLRLSEAVVVSPAVPGVHEGWGGTFDLLCYDADGRTVLADIKTGKGVYREAILQLAAYGMAQYVSPMGAAEVYPMPNIDRYCVIHVTKDGVRPIEIDVGAQEWAAWLSTLDLYRWTEYRKGWRP